MGALRSAVWGHRLPEPYVERTQQVYRWVIPVYGLLVGQKGAATLAQDPWVGMAYLAQAVLAMTAAGAILARPRSCDVIMRLFSVMLVVGHELRVFGIVAGPPQLITELHLAALGFLGIAVAVQTVFSAHHASMVTTLHCCSTIAVAVATVVWRVAAHASPASAYMVVLRFSVLLGVLTFMMRVMAQLMGQRVRLEHEATMRAIRAGERAKRAFLMHMSHDLRTPLNGILGSAQLLARDQAATSDQRQHAHMIVNGGERLLGTLNGLLVMADLEGAGEDGLPLIRSTPPRDLHGPSAADVESAALNAELDSLHPETRDEMQRAIAACDLARLTELVDTIASEHAVLAKAMYMMAARYDYEALRSLTAVSRGPRSVDA